MSRHAPEVWEPAIPLYADGRYAQAAEVGRTLIEQHPDQAFLHFNVACCESLAGRTREALEHLRRAIERWDGFRELAAQDSDFDPIRGEPGFRALVGDGD